MFNEVKSFFLQNYVKYMIAFWNNVELALKPFNSTITKLNKNEKVMHQLLHLFFDSLS